MSDFENVGSSIMEILRRISIPRRAGSGGEREIRDYILERLRLLFPQERIQIQDFSFTPELGVKLLGNGLFALFFLFFYNYLCMFYGGILTYGGWIFPLAILVFTGFGGRWGRTVEKRYLNDKNGRVSTCNLEAVMDVGAEETLIFSAHYDSKSQPVNFVLRGFLMAFASALAGLSALYSLFYYSVTVYQRIAGAVLSQRFILLLRSGNWTAVTLSVVSFLIFLFMWLMKSENRSPGAMDNASGVAVLLKLAERFSLQAPCLCNVRLVFTGAEEEGLVGAVHYVNDREKSLNPEKTSLINLDGVGGKGKLFVIDRYGFPPVETGAGLSEKIMSVALTSGLSALRFYSPPGAGYDSIPFAFHGIESVTLAHCGFDSALLNVHSNKDCPENIEPEALENAFRLCVSLVYGAEQSTVA